MGKKNKLSKEDLLKSQMIDRVKNTILNADTFWQPRMNEVLPMYKEYLEAHPEDLEFVLKAYAWHMYHYALKPR